MARGDIFRNIWQSRAVWPFRQETGKVLLNFWVMSLSGSLAAIAYAIIARLYGLDAVLFGRIPVTYLAQAAVMVIFVRFLWSLIRRGS